MTPKWHSLATLAALFLLSSSAHAALIEFQFSGRVTYGGSLATVGTPIAGEFSYDTDTLPVFVPLPGYNNYQPLVPGFSAQVGGHTIVTSSLDITVLHNYVDSDADAVYVLGPQPLVDGVSSYPDGLFGFSLASKGGTHVLSSDALPASFDVNAYDAGSSYNGGGLQSDGGPNGQLLQFSIDAVTSTVVPAPPAAFLLSSAIAVLGLFKRRK